MIATIVRKPASDKTHNVASYISRQIDLCGKTQREISEAIGYPHANVITMIKKGQTKLPITKIGPLAKALEIDPVFLLRMVLKEYMPETWDAIEQVTKQPILTENEIQMLGIIRKANSNNPKIQDAAERDVLIAAVKKLKGDND